MYDLLAWVPLVATAAMTLMTTLLEAVRWRKATAAGLTVLTLIATVTMQRHESSIKAADQTHRSGVRERLGELVTEGQQLIVECEDQARSVPVRSFKEWNRKTKTFLGALGNAY